MLTARHSQTQIPSGEYSVQAHKMQTKERHGYVSLRDGSMQYLHNDSYRGPTGKDNVPSTVMKIKETVFQPR